MNTTTIAPGTQVHITNRLALPFGDRGGDPYRTVLNPEDYTTTQGVQQPPHTSTNRLLVATPDGWSAYVAPGKPDEGTHVTLWWVSPDDMVVMQKPSPPGFMPTENTDCVPRSEFTAAVEQRDGLGHALDESQREASSLRDRLNEAREQHEAFRTQVRDVAIRVADEQDWCVNGLNEVLDELDLPKRTREYEVQVEVKQTITVTVEAVDEEEAQEKVEEMDADDLVREHADNWDWEKDVESVSEA